MSRDRMAARVLLGITGDGFSLSHQQTAEMADITAGNHSLNDINPLVQKAAGLDVTKRSCCHQKRSKLSPDLLDTRRVIGNLVQTMLCIQLALPLFDMGMKGPFANPSCHGWLSEVTYIIRHGIWICNVIYCMACLGLSDELHV
jgi:hypothetical protein